MTIDGVREDAATSVLGRREIILLGILVLLANVPRLFVNYVDWDEAAVMAESWAMTQGQVLYRDIVQIHPLLNFLIVVPFFYVLSPERVPLAIRTMNMMLVLLGALFVARLVFRWLANRRLAFLGGLLFVFYCSAMDVPPPSLYGEFYAMLPLVLSLQTLYFADHPRPLTYYFTGCLWGMAFFFKQSAAFDMLGLFIAYICLVRFPRTHKAAATGWMALGLTTMVLAVSVYCLAHGTVLNAWHWMFVRPLLYANASGAGRSQGIYRLAFQLIFKFWLPLAAAILGLHVIRKPRSATEADGHRGGPFFLVIAVWSSVNVAGLCVIGRFYPHYLFQLVPAASLAPLFILSRTSARTQLAAVAALTCAIFALTADGFASEMSSLSRAHWIPARVHQSDTVARYIRAHTERGDRIFLYGVDNLDIFFLSRRLSNNGVYMFADMMAENMHDMTEQQRLRKRFLAHLPSIIVTGNKTDIVKMLGRLPRVYTFTPSTAEFFREVLTNHYHLETTLDGLHLYSRTASPTAVNDPGGTRGLATSRPAASRR
jgi:hypothetical protein